MAQEQAEGALRGESGQDGDTGRVTSLGGSGELLLLPGLGSSPHSASTAATASDPAAP